MPQPAYDYELSVMEDLDPEPAARAGSVRAREVVVGVLLLLAVLAWAGWRWWYDESVRNTYELGRQAVIEQRWEDARDYFGAAGDYKDAPTRAAEADKQIEARDKQYGLARSHAEAREWAAAFRAAREASAIQPRYKDLETLLAQTESQVYSEALSGTFAMRLRDDPGLFYRDAERWVRLERSDQWSDIRSRGASGITLYDAPGPGWAPQPSPTPTRADSFGPTPGFPDLAGRQLMAASFREGSGPVFHKLALDPARYNYYVQGEAGVWGIRFPTRAEMSIPVMPVQGFPEGFELGYEEYGSGITSTLRIAHNMAVTDLGATGKHMLVAQLDREAEDRGRVRLYVAGPDGSQPRLVYTTTSGIKNARFSPDERYVLVITVDHIEEERGRMAAVLVDLQSDAPPRTLVENDAVVYFGDTWMHVDQAMGVSASFLYKGYFKNKLLVASTLWDAAARGYATDIRLIDLEQPNWTIGIAHLPSDGQSGSGVPIFEHGDGNALVIHSSSYGRSYLPRTPVTTSLSIARFEPSQVPYTYLPVQPLSYERVFLASPQDSGYRPNFSNFMVRGKDLIYSVDTAYNTVFTSTFYSVPTFELGKKEPERKEVLSFTRLGDNGARPSVVMGPGMFAYVDESNALHARTYDGGVDVVLERGVRFLRSESNYYSYYSAWLR